MSNAKPIVLVSRLLALLVGVAAGCQASLGSIVMQQPGSVVDTHKVVGMITIVVTIAAAVVTWLAVKAGGRPISAYIAIALAVLSVIQFGLGEMGAKMVHISLGFMFLIGAVALLFTSMRRTSAPSNEV